MDIKIHLENFQKDLKTDLKELIYRTAYTSALTFSTMVDKLFIDVLNKLRTILQ